MPATELGEREKLGALIGSRVLREVGEPGELLQVQVRNLWGTHYRVNVLTGLNSGAAKVAHSYFIVVDGNGNILESTPALLKLY
jgi:hypothetical protein